MAVFHVILTRCISHLPGKFVAPFAGSLYYYLSKGSNRFIEELH